MSFVCLHDRDELEAFLSLDVTAALCRRLLARGIDHIGLNVREGNHAARTLYEGLGFVTHLLYQEGLAGPLEGRPS